VGNGVTAFDAQTFYGVWDDLANPITARAQLAARSAQVPIGSTVVNVTGDPFNYGNSSTDRRGWLLDLPSGASDGERVINPALLSFGRVVFNSVILGADPCANGQSRSYTLNALQGTGRVAASGAGYLATPLLLRTLLGTGVTDPTGFRADSVSSALVNLGTTGQEVRRQQDVAVPTGAWTWRQILNWKELRR
jgi:type IV pilus assembly protein PilY1